MAEPIILAQAKAARGNPDPVGLVLSKLDGVVCLRSGQKWKAHCPAHDDNVCSLSVGVGDHGDCLLYCHASCTVDAIVAKLGLTKSDLFLEAQRGGSMSYSDPPIEAVYDYTNLSGQTVHQTVRYKGKGFKQRHPNGAGYVWSLEGVETVLYRLPDLMKAPPDTPIHIVEGEKDADRLVSLGLVATTNPMGAGSWKPEYNRWLEGRHVIILPDNDGSGQRHALQVARSLYGTAASIKIVLLPGLPEKGDVSDWLSEGWTVEGLRKAIADAPYQESLFSFTPNDKREKRHGPGLYLTELRLLLQEPEEVTDFIVGNLLPSGGMSILAAKPKVGKSTLGRNMALCVARGEPFLGVTTAQGPVVYLALEEKRAEVAKHFARMGGQEEPIYVHTGAAPEHALEALTLAVAEHQPVLAIIDPLFRFVQINNGNDYAEVYAKLGPVIDLARESNCHMCMLHHMGKGEREGADGLLGSTAFRGAMDTIMMMKRHEQQRTFETEQRYGTDWPRIVITMDAEHGTTSAGGQLEEVQLYEIEEQIKDFLREREEPVDEKTIWAAINADNAKIAKALRRLVEYTDVDREGAGRSGSPYLYSLYVVGRAAES